MPEPVPVSIALHPTTHEALAAATFALGELRGIGRTLVNPSLVIRPFARREAVLSSRIEGTTAGLADLVLFEANPLDSIAQPDDVREVANYLAALFHGLALLDRMPICNWLIQDVHAVLLTGVRGHERRPGAFRTVQNAIGVYGLGLEAASFIPPPVAAMRDAMNALARYIGEQTATSHPLVQIALIHYQVEAIHPFMDGNGRLGRLLIPLFLHERGVMPQPLLYLSAYFERHRDEYLARLLAVSQHGAWDAWLQFFLRGVQEQAAAAIAMAERLLGVQDNFRARIRERRGSTNLAHLIDVLFESPAITAAQVSTRVGLTPAAAYSLIQRLVELGILHQVAGVSAPRVFVANAIVQATMPEEQARDDGGDANSEAPSRHDDA